MVEFGKIVHLFDKIIPLFGNVVHLIGNDVTLIGNVVLPNFGSLGLTPNPLALALAGVHLLTCLILPTFPGKYKGPYIAPYIIFSR